jgi:hypothetical protein
MEFQFYIYIEKSARKHDQYPNCIQWVAVQSLLILIIPDVYPFLVLKSLWLQRDENDISKNIGNRRINVVSVHPILGSLANLGPMLSLSTI